MLDILADECFFYFVKEKIRRDKYNTARETQNV